MTRVQGKGKGKQLLQVDGHSGQNDSREGEVSVVSAIQSSPGVRRRRVKRHGASQAQKISADDAVSLVRRELEEERLAMLDAISAERARLEAEISGEREALARDRRQLEAEQPWLQLVGKRQQNTILLDVGGIHYRTSRLTLTSVPGSMLEAMFAGRNDALLHSDTDGRIFIDRDGKPFGHILNFLRDPSALESLDLLSPSERLAVRREACYYGLEDEMFPSKVWVFGGQTFFEEFDARSMRFQPRHPLLVSREYCAVVQMSKSQLLVVGGSEAASMTDSTEVLDLSTMVFAPGPHLGCPREKCAAIKLDDYRVLVIGGTSDVDGDDLATTEVLYPCTRQFVAGPKLISERVGCTAIRLDEERILVLGGFNLRSTEVLDLRSMTFTEGPVMNEEREGCVAVKLDEDRIIVIGGYRNLPGESSDSDDSEFGAFETMVSRTTEILSLTAMCFTPGPMLNEARAYCAATVLDASRVLVLGGESRAQDAQLEDEDEEVDMALATTEILDTSTLKFSAGPRMCENRSGCAAICLRV
eukprot:TRINITY_DN80494_c0_g1_i1.p1 TRINITY_DN80494_c0_g1~~TRINITY_DN80494_c0_g1_i1.p1  ORF type:complete len:531 (-),score=84.31 TRINITY_DN80494_c0_g1_i1:51-1643(-)